jgi:phage terminase large subunit-like protein
MRRRELIAGGLMLPLSSVLENTAAAQIYPSGIAGWDTSCRDWEERIMAGTSLVPDLPLFKPEAAKALRVFKRLKIPDMIGTPRLGDVCGPWFYPIIAALFGAYERETNIRHISEAFLLIPKGNGKSSLGGAVMLTAIIVNRRPEAEFMFIAPTMEIASIAYRQAKGTIRLDEELSKIFHVQDHIRKITHRNTGATLAIKAADTDVITGSKATGTMIDETHQFAKKSNAAEVFIELRGALTKRPDGFLFQTTTQSKTTPSGQFASELAMARSVRDGKMRMPMLPVLYELPERYARDGGWRDPSSWHLVNPNLGRSTNADFLAREVMRADADGPAAVALIASQHFNVQIGMSLRADGWAGANYWKRGAEEGLGLEEVLARSEAVVVGIDGGGLDDLLGIAVVGREKDTNTHLAWTHALISPEGLERRKANAGFYEKFQNDGDLTVIEELPDDISFVVDVVEKVKETKKLAGVGVDAIGIGGIVDALAKVGVTQENNLLAGVRQGISLMGAIKTVERKLVDGSFKHGDQALMTWCAGNARIVPTPTGMRIARDDSGYGKIDPLMALFNASALMAMNPAANQRPEARLFFA